MKDLYDLKKPHVQMMQRKNNILPFEDVTPIEKFVHKNNTPFFMFALHNKKRPNNIIFGRTFEHTLLDMVEFEVENYKGLKDFKVPKISAEIKPLLVFNGEFFDTNHEYGRIKNLLIDMFQHDIVENIRLQGLEHVLSFTAVDNKILLRCYRIQLKKSNSRIPRIELEKFGPRSDLLCRRTKLASEDLFKQSCKKPKELKVKKKKNIFKDTFGTTYGRIHVGSQNINSIQTRKMKGLKKTLAERKLEKQMKQYRGSAMESNRLKTTDN